MSTHNNTNKRRKHLPALIVAFGVTACIAVAMVALGANAFLNPASAAEAAGPTELVIPDSATTEDLRAIILEYQAREAQYQTELTQAAEQVNQANAQVHQYQSLLADLQSLGVIQVDANGQVTVTMPQIGFAHEEHEGFGGDDD